MMPSPRADRQAPKTERSRHRGHASIAQPSPATRRRPRFTLGLGLVSVLLLAALPATAADPASLLRERLTDATVTGNPRIADALHTFYRLRDYAPAWTTPSRRTALRRALTEVTADGLDPDDYLSPPLRTAWAGNPSGFDPDTELLASRAALTALSHLLNGKVDPRALNPDWNFHARQIDTEAELRGLSEAIEQGRLIELFAQAHPPHPLYDQLKAGLRRLRAIQRNGGWPAIAPGETLKPGMTGPRVEQLRQRLLAGDYAMAHSDEPATFDPALEQAVKQFQREYRLTADGAVGKATLAELNAPIEWRIDQMRVNLERARWLLHERSREFLLVDIAGFEATYFKDGAPVWHTRVQVGQPFRKTPEYRSQITHLDFNPTWTVPPTIFRKDIVPKVRRDIGYLAANRLRVLDATTGLEISPAQVDWSAPKGILIRQDAGPRSALGRVVIRFANPYAVYLHDTPHSAIFDHDERAVSSGCIRVEHPLELTERLLDDPIDWSREKIEAAIATGRTQRVHLPRAVTVLLAYWSVDVHPDGRVSFRRDIYGRDAAVMAELERH